MTSVSDQISAPPRARRGAASARLEVLPSRLRPPYRRPGIIDRPRLVARMRAADTPIVALIAPAGYGKSTALAAFVDVDARSTAWYSADPRDSDPGTLVRGLAAAIDRALALPDEAIVAAAAPGRSVWTVAVPRLAAALVDAPPTFTLVVDDVDRIGDPEAVGVILALADQMAGASRLVLSGRSFGAFSPARLAAEGRVTTLGRDDLALDEAETAGLLEASGRNLSELDVRRLARRTEGWAAGIYLSSLAEEANGTPTRGVSPTAPERHIEEYLRTEILAQMAPSDADLILRSSVLDRLSGPLCDAVLERTGSAADLDRLERTNLLLIPLDEDRRWFRYHHLLGDLLRREFERRDALGIVDLRRRAAAWHESNDLPEVALEYAMAAEDRERAARLTVRLGQVAMNAGRTDTVRRWFGWFDERDAGTSDPRLAGYATMVFALQGDSVRTSRWADLADRAGTIHDDDADAGLRAIARVMTSRTGIGDLVRDATTALDLIPDGDPLRVAALISVGVAHQLTGDTAAADTYANRAVALWDEGSFANTAVCLALIHLAGRALEDGDRAAAEAHVHKARGILVSNGLSEEPLAVAVDALDARVAMARGAAERARADLAHAQRLRPHLGVSFPWLAIRARLDLIRAHLAMGDPGGARTIMHEVVDVLTLRPDMGTLVDECAEVEGRLRTVGGGVAGASSLTLAELRLLPLLTTHLSFREIGDRLFVSQNTVKTQAISIYRKLDATSRGEAIERAVSLGLLESARSTERFIHAG